LEEEYREAQRHLAEVLQARRDILDGKARLDLPADEVDQALDKLTSLMDGAFPNGDYRDVMDVLVDGNVIDKNNHPGKSVLLAHAYFRGVYEKGLLDRPGYFARRYPPVTWPVSDADFSFLLRWLIDLHACSERVAKICVKNSILYESGLNPGVFISVGNQQHCNQQQSVPADGEKQVDVAPPPAPAASVPAQGDGGAGRGRRWGTEPKDQLVWHVTRRGDLIKGEEKITPIGCWKLHKRIDKGEKLGLRKAFSALTTELVAAFQASGVNLIEYVIEACGGTVPLWYLKFPP
jgi:hypothetical protein